MDSWSYEIDLFALLPRVSWDDRYNSFSLCGEFKAMTSSLFSLPGTVTGSRRISVPGSVYVQHWFFSLQPIPITNKYLLLMPDTDMITNHFILSKEVPIVYAKETGAKTEGDTVLELYSVWEKLMCFLSIEACKPPLIVTQNKIINV